MPDGRPGRIISCRLWGRTTWKELGNTTLEALGYPAEGRRDQTYIWREVLRQAKREGVVGIHYDECQHMFTDTGEAANRIVLDSFKALLKEQRWPMVLILSGVPALAKHIEKERPSEDPLQLRFLLTPVHIEMINPSEDVPELNALAYSHAEKAGICFDEVSNMDFFQRLIHGCAYRWGLVIEMVLELSPSASWQERQMFQSVISSKHFLESTVWRPGFHRFSCRTTGKASTLKSSWTCLIETADTSTVETGVWPAFRGPFCVCPELSQGFAMGVHAYAMNVHAYGVDPKLALASH